MDIKKWHYGKLIILGIWSIVILYLCIQFLEKIENLFLGFFIIIIIIAIPVTFSIITWKWLSGKE